MNEHSRAVRDYVNSQRNLCHALAAYGPAIARDMQCHRELCEQGQGWCLLVDDEPNILRGFRRFLGKAGWQIKECETAEAARRWLAECPLPEVAILDLQLDGNETGIDLSKRLHRCTRLYFVTGVIPEERLLKALAESCGANGAFLKGSPESLSALFAAVGSPRSEKC